MSEDVFEYSRVLEDDCKDVKDDRASPDNDLGNFQIKIPEG